VRVDRCFRLRRMLGAPAALPLGTSPHADAPPPAPHWRDCSPMEAGMPAVHRRHWLVLAALPMLPRTLLAQERWPARPVRIVVPFAPGGTTDILARSLAPELSRAFGQQFIVDNKPGAGGNIGAAEVAKAAPDGYTLLMGTVGTHGINQSLYPKMPFDPIKDFAPITLVAGVPTLLV